MDYLKSVFRNLWGFAVENMPTIGKGIAAVWFYFGGIHLYIYAVIALTVADVITGLLAARKRGEVITSRKLRKGLLEKTFIYLGLMLTVFVLDLVLKSVLGYSNFYFVFILTFLISTYEVVSIFENIQVLRPSVPFLNALIRIFRKMGNRTVEKLEDKVDDIVDKSLDVQRLTNERSDKEDVVELNSE